MNNKILILGGEGYIGSRLYAHLSQFYEVHSVDLGWFGTISSNYLEADYNSLSKEYLNNYSVIILLAGHSSVSMCQNNLESCFKNNVNNFNNLLFKLNDSQMFIYASSAAVYGKNPDLVDEDSIIPSPTNEYDLTKIINEQVVSVYNRPNTVGLRLGTVSGFSKNMRIENLLNALTLCAIEKNEISISNGSLMRSALGMSDLCRAIEAIIRKGKVKRPIYNLTSVNDSIVNFGYSIQKMKPNVRLVTSNALKTGYSFNCSNELFKKDYNFEFLDTVESIYSDIEYNYHNIVHSVPRSVKSYY